MSASRRRETLLNFGLGGIEGCARNLVGGRGRVRRRLQLGAGVLRDVGEIGRQSWRPNGRRFGLGSIVVWFGHGVSPGRCEANQGRPLFVPCASKRGQRGWHLPRPLAEYLRECGYLVLEASSAADARTLLEDGSRRVDIPTLHTRTPRPCFYHYL